MPDGLIFCWDIKAKLVVTDRKRIHSYKSVHEFCTRTTIISGQAASILFSFQKQMTQHSLLTAKSKTIKHSTLCSYRDGSNCYVLNKCTIYLCHNRRFQSIQIEDYRFCPFNAYNAAMSSGIGASFTITVSASVFPHESVNA